jgi:hypothetical protein
MTRHGAAARRSTTPNVEPPSPPVGFDPIVVGRYRRSGLLPSRKAPAGSRNSYIFTSDTEWQLGLWLELNPNVKEYGRVDVHPDAARNRKIEAVSGMTTCLPLRYAFDGQIRHYLPDAGARLVDGSPALFEAGLAAHKSGDDARAAFAAARDYLALEGGTFGLLLKGDLTRRWFHRSLWLHHWRFAYFGSESLLADIDAAWLARRASPRQLVEEFGDRDRSEIVTHAVFKVAGDALAAGRLQHDLDRDDFDLDTMTRLRAPGGRLAIPKPLRLDVPDGTNDLTAANDDDARDLAWINPEWLEPDAAADLMARKEAVRKIHAGAPAAAFVEVFGGVSPRRVQQIYVAWTKFGDPALIRYGTANRRGSRLPEEVKKPIRAALRRRPRSTAQEIAEDQSVVDASRAALGKLPRADRIERYLEELRTEDPAYRARPSGRGRVTDANAAGFTATFDNRPGFIVEYDGERMNLVAQLLPGLPDTARVERLRAKDVATSCPVGEVFSLHVPDQGELRRLLHRIARDKADLVARSNAKNPWPMRCWPMVWSGDNAWIDEAEMFVGNLPEMGVTVVLQGAKRPEMKGTVESGFGKDQKIHQDRQPHSTGRSPETAEGRAPARYAAEHGIGVRDVEADALRSTIDGDLWGPNRRLRGRPIDLGQAGLRRYPVRTWEGPPGELARLLRRPVPSGLMSGGRVSYLGRDYSMTWAGDPDDDPRNDLPYPVLRSAPGLHGLRLQMTVDDDDIRMLEVHEPASGVTVYLVCNRLKEYGRPVSEFEFQLEKVLDRGLEADAVRSRSTAQSETRDRVRSLPRKRVARSLSRQTELLARAEEIRGAQPKAATRRARTTRARVAPSKATQPVTFRPRPSRFATPAIHHQPADLSVGPSQENLR